MRHMLEYAPVGYTASDPNNLPQVGHPHNMTTRNAAPYTAYPTAGTKAENYHTAQRERERERGEGSAWQTSIVMLKRFTTTLLLPEGTMLSTGLRRRSHLWGKSLPRRTLFGPTQEVEPPTEIAESEAAACHQLLLVVLPSGTLASAPDATFQQWHRHVFKILTTS